MSKSKKIGHKLLAWFLALTMVAAYVPMVGDSVYAADTSSMTIDRADATYELGEPIIVTATSSDEESWVGLYCSNNDSQTCMWDNLVKADKSGKAFNLTADYHTWNHDPSVGSGSVYLGAADGNITIPITLTECTHEKSVTVDEETCNTASKLKVNVVSSGSSDWVAVYEGTHTTVTNFKDLTYVGPYSYTYGHNHSSIELGYLDAGDYTVALLKDGGYEAAAVDTFTVTDAGVSDIPTIPTVATDKTTYKYGEPINVTTTSKYSYTSKDWVGIYKKGDVPGGGEGNIKSISWYYISTYPDGFDITDFENSKDGAVPPEQQVALFNGKIKAGEYVIYIFNNDTYDVIAQTDITIEKEPYGEPEVTPAGCEKEGSSVQWYTDGTNVSTPISALEHNWSDYTYDAETKTHSRTCSASEHAAEVGNCEFEVDGEPVVEAAGTTTTYKCKVCKGTYSETVASGFVFSKNVTVDATCTTDGETYELWVNETTGEEMKVNVTPIPAIKHAWGKWTPVGENATTHERVCGNDPEHKETGDCNRDSVAFRVNELVSACSVCGSEDAEAILTMEKKVYDADEDIIVKVNNPAGNNNWIGIFYSTDGHNESTEYPNAPAKGWTYVLDTKEFNISDKSISDYLEAKMKATLSPANESSIEKTFEICANFTDILMLLEKIGESNSSLGKVHRQSYDNVKNIADYINENYMNKIDSKIIEKLFSINYDYANRIFKQYFGLSINRYRNKRRIDRAKFLLVTTNKTLEEIAQEVGFEDKYYFSRLFAKYEGISPLQYRNG